MKEWENVQNDRCFNILLQLDSRLKSANNRQIYKAIRNNKQLLKENKGKFSTEDLDFYLDDITSITEAEDRELIKQEDIYNWFEDYFIGTLANKEVREYLANIRKSSPNSYEGLEETVNRLIEHKKKGQK